MANELNKQRGITSGVFGRRVGILLTGAFAVVLLVTPGASGSARFVWNTSASAPAGIYLISHGQWRVGDRVAVQPAAKLAAELDRLGVLSKGKMLIKRIAAGQGMTVCRHGVRVFVDGVVVAIAKTRSSKGVLPTWTGCMKLGANDIFLLGDTPNSYDGRYFGINSADEVAGPVRLLIPFTAG